MSSKFAQKRQSSDNSKIEKGLTTTPPKEENKNRELMIMLGMLICYMAWYDMTYYDTIVWHMLWHDVFVNICYRCANICKVRTMHICYVMFMLTGCWAMNIYVRLTCYMYSRVPFYTRTTFIQKQTIQDIQPSTRPRINIYIYIYIYMSGSGWEMSVCFGCLCVYVCLWVFMCLFMCLYVFVVRL